MHVESNANRCGRGDFERTAGRPNVSNPLIHGRNNQVQMCFEARGFTHTRQANDASLPIPPSGSRDVPPTRRDPEQRTLI